MEHRALLKARVINMLDDTRRYFLKVRQEVGTEYDNYADIKAVIAHLEKFSKMVSEDEPGFVPFDGVFYLTNNESDAFRIKYRAHRVLNPR